MRVLFFLFFFSFPLEEICLAPPAPAYPLPLSNWERLFPHCGLESKKSGFIFSGDL